MKQNLLCIIFLLCILSSNNAITAPNINLVANSSFEAHTIATVDGNIPLNWTVSNSGGSLAQFGVSSYHKHSIKQSGYIFDNNYAKGLGLISDKITVSPGYTYLARAFLRKDNSQTFKMHLVFYDVNDQRIEIKATSCSSLYHFEENKILATAPINAAYARIQFYVWANPLGGYFWFDSVSLTLADERIANGEFTDCVSGILPEHWITYTSHPGSIQAIYNNDNDNDNLLRLYDDSPIASCSVARRVPVNAGEPYKLTCDVKKVSGTGNIGVYLRFYDSNDQQLESHVAYTGSNTWTNLSISTEAPIGATYAKIICYSFTGTIGESWFDNFSFRENYTIRYASPTGNGTRDGTSLENAAIYNSSTFLDAINMLANERHVKVLLSAGEYHEHWLLTEFGNSNNRIIFEGQYPYGTDFVDSGSSVNDYITITNAKNLCFKYLHFTSSNENTIPYIIRILGSAVSTYDITLQGCSFTNIKNILYGIISVSGTLVHNIKLEYSSWIKIGNDIFDHCIYAANGAKLITINSNYFEDCTGSYIRFRNRAEGEAEDNYFLSTGLISTNDPNGRVHLPFIQICAFNNESDDNEILGSNFKFTNNDFTYLNINNPGYLSPFNIYVSGSPANYPNYHLVPISDGNIIEDVTQNNDTRINKIEIYFGINLETDFIVSGNSYTQCWDRRLIMSVTPFELGYWNRPMSETEEDNVDLDKLVGLE